MAQETNQLVTPGLSPTYAELSNRAVPALANAGLTVKALPKVFSSPYSSTHCPGALQLMSSAPDVGLFFTRCHPAAPAARSNETARSADECDELRTAQNPGDVQDSDATANGRGREDVPDGVELR